LETLALYADCILRINARYGNSGRNINVSYELGTRVRARLNLEGLGFLDVRRYYTKTDKTEGATAHGVRIPSVEIPAFCEKITIIRDFLVEQREKIKNIVKKSRFALLSQ
jgi:hypothetical protein